MGWSIGFDSNWNRDIGYGVPCICDHPECIEEIDRGLAYVCGGEPYGGEYGCGLYFCGNHQYLPHKDMQYGMLCENCSKENGKVFEPKPDIKEWIEWKLMDESWSQWRKENPDEIEMLVARLNSDKIIKLVKT